jgi:hypothetical protein
MDLSECAGRPLQIVPHISNAALTLFPFSTSVLGIFAGITTKEFTESQLRGSVGAVLYSHYAASVAQFLVGMWVGPVVAMHGIDLINCTGQPILLVVRRDLLFASFFVAFASTSGALVLAIRSVQAGPRALAGEETGSQKESRPAASVIGRASRWCAWRFGLPHVRSLRHFWAALVVLAVGIVGVAATLRLSLDGPFSTSIDGGVLAAQLIAALVLGAPALLVCLQFADFGQLKFAYGRVVGSVMLAGVVHFVHVIGLVAFPFFSETAEHAAARAALGDRATQVLVHGGALALLWPILVGVAMLQLVVLFAEIGTYR